MGPSAASRGWIHAALAGAGALVLALLTPIGTDYVVDTQPAIDALRHGALGEFFADQPSMGPLSLWLRWAPALLADALGGGDLAIYRSGALACLLPSAVVITALARLLSRRGGLGRGEILLLVAVLSLNPVTLRALELGHPEEPLGAALCLAAVLLAATDRVGAAGIALGLALATKQWALFAVLPTLLAAPPGRAAATRILVPAAGVALAAYLPMLLADPQAFAAALDRPVGGLGEMRPANLWHALVTDGHQTSIGGGEFVQVQLVPQWLRAAAHPGIALLALGAPAAWWWRAPARATAAQALALLAFVFLLRCWLDPWNHEYYHLPMLLALAGHETVGRGRAPIVTLASTALLWVVFARLAEPGVGPAIDVLYLAWALPLSAWLAAGVVRAPRAATMQEWIRTPAQDQSPLASRIVA